ncbi:hypothetical protein TMatcc_001673 [Talaromyces marneffei ATCC 18224]
MGILWQFSFPPSPRVIVLGWKGVEMIFHLQHEFNHNGSAAQIQINRLGRRRRVIVYYAQR